MAKSSKSESEFVEPDKVAEASSAHDGDSGVSVSESEPAVREAGQPDGPKSKPAHTAKNGGGNKFKQLLSWYTTHKKLSIPLTILVLISLLAAIPPTRYALAGTVLKNDVTITVLDESTKKPVSKADVNIGGTTVQSDAKGVAKFHVPVGYAQVHVGKKYYADGNGKVLVKIFSKSSSEVTVKATGRQVPFRVLNKITTAGIEGAIVSAAGTEVKTTFNGKAIIVLPPDNPKTTATIKAKGFNDLEVTIPVEEHPKGDIVFEMVPEGKIYFLSRLSGKIDVVKTNLDGSDRKTVLAGTGKEDQYDTVLLASTDWRYLALKSRRDGGQYSKLFLIDTSNDKVTTMDEGKATFEIVGWSDHLFVYKVNRVEYTVWQPKQQALKSYNASNAKITILDESFGEGSSGYDFVLNKIEDLNSLGKEIVYSKTWSASDAWKLNGRAVSLMSIKADGSGKKTIKDFAVPPGRSYHSIQIRPYEAHALYVQAGTEDWSTYNYFEYEHGKITEKKDLTQDEFEKPYPTFLISPEGDRTFWSDDRDGKNVLFVGNDDGEDGKQVASLSEYQTYGWYTDKYLLISKKGSELYIMQVAGGDLIKITDYHKPSYSFRGYGGGYGGL